MPNRETDQRADSQHPSAVGNVLVLLAAAFGLSSCGMLVRTAMNRSGKSPAARVAAEQGTAISEAGGGVAGAPIAWSDSKSGMQGSLLLTANAGAGGCHEFWQTVILAGETLQGQLLACPQPNGAWKVMPR
jgi:hypothetical protein